LALAPLLCVPEFPPVCSEQRLAGHGYAAASGIDRFHLQNTGQDFRTRPKFFQPTDWIYFFGMSLTRFGDGKTDTEFKKFEICFQKFEIPRVNTLGKMREGFD
jgi:hypothetical protein